MGFPGPPGGSGPSPRSRSVAPAGFQRPSPAPAASGGAPAFWGRPRCSLRFWGGRTGGTPREGMASLGAPRPRRDSGFSLNELSQSRGAAGRGGRGPRCALPPFRCAQPPQVRSAPAAPGLCLPRWGNEGGKTGWGGTAAGKPVQPAAAWGSRPRAPNRRVPPAAPGPPPRGREGPARPGLRAGGACGVRGWVRGVPPGWRGERFLCCEEAAGLWGLGFCTGINAACFSTLRLLRLCPC